jgi:hypothetical protein
MVEISRQVVGARHRGAVLNVIVSRHVLCDNGNVAVPFVGEHQSGCKTYDASPSSRRQLGSQLEQHYAYPTTTTLVFWTVIISAGFYDKAAGDGYRMICFLRHSFTCGEAYPTCITLSRVSKSMHVMCPTYLRLIEQWYILISKHYLYDSVRFLAYCSLPGHFTLVLVVLR